MNTLKIDSPFHLDRALGKSLRIISLLPAATEIVHLLGLEKNLVGVSDDSDYPESVQTLPKIVTTTVPSGLTSLEIDDHVRDAKHRGAGIFHIDKSLLQKLKPNLILSQELCGVCAIGASEIKKAARILKNDVKTISLEPESVEDIFGNIKLIASLTDKEREAEKIIQKLKKRVDDIYRTFGSPKSDQIFFTFQDDARLGLVEDSKLKISSSLNDRKRIRSKNGSDENFKLAINSLKSKKDLLPKVLIIEWIDPIMVAGHWVPEMVEIAGGVNLGSKVRETSKRITWEEVQKLNPDILIISPCGFDIKRTMEEIGLITSKKGYSALKSVKNNRVYLLNGNAYLTRPGPRIIDGIEILAEIIHPEKFVRLYKNTDWQKI